MMISQPVAAASSFQPAVSQPQARNVAPLPQNAVPGCRLCRALANRIRPESEAIWAVGSVTVDDIDRFASNDR
jgi:hypothetical protein